MQLGADDYITKPFSLHELLKVIKTRLNKHEQLEQDNNEKFHALIDHPVLGIYIYQNGKIILHNKTLAAIFGYSYDEFSSINLEDLLDDKYCNKTKILNEIDRCLKESKGSISFKFEALHNTLNTVFVELFGSVITYKGHTSIVGNVIRLDNENPSPFIFKETKDLSSKLTSRELEVLELICVGKSTLEVSKSLFLGQRTIETYRANLLEKTGSKNIAELIIYAVRNGLIRIR